MTNQVSATFRRCGLGMALSIAALSLVGCEGGKEAESTAETTQPNMQLNLSDQDSQIQILKARLFDEPENEQLLMSLGNAYFEAQRFLDAIPVYEKAVAINPNNTNALNDLGLSYYYIGESEKGLAMVDRATQANPSYKHPWLSKGFMLFSMGRYNEAIAPLNKLKELDAGGPMGSEADRFLEEIRKRTGQPAG